MQNKIRKSRKGSKTAYLNICAWYDPKTEHIHLTLPNPGGFHTTVNAKETSKRSHPNLYFKLARALKEAGVPSPEVANTE